MYQKELEDFSIEKIADSGQCFRIVPGDYGYVVVAFGKVLNVRHEGRLYSFSCDEEEFKAFWQKYFDLEKDYEKYRCLALPEDEYLAKAIHFGKGIRILRQDPWEVLISFIISQRKRVSAIRTSVERLAVNFGRSIDGKYYAFPTPEEMRLADIDLLKTCGLGYRIDFVRKAAESVADGRIDLKKMEKLKTPKLIEKLMELDGVGIKVSSCVALFGFHRLEVCPMDVWMNRVIHSEYGGHFPKAYLPYMGVIQQYMYDYARLNKIGVRGAFDHG